jgi:ATPase subunit of ABC transporter with duplicated ATPase domains
MIAAADPAAGELRSRLGIREDWGGRWESLSHGERKRAQIAVALWIDPQCLCIDEPTNHVDSATRALLRRGLEAYRGIGLLVSHDRELLDLLCTRCLMMSAQGAVLRPGNYTQAVALDAAEKRRHREEWARLKEEERRLRRSVVEKKREVARSRGRLSKRHLARDDHDAKGRIDLARITSKDRAPARMVREMEGRLARVSQTASGITGQKEYELGLWFRSERAQRDALVTLAADRLSLGSGRGLEIPDLVVQPRDRVALTGPNGSGKSTLIRRIVAELALPPGRLIYMPQEVEASASERIAAELRELEGRDLGRAMTVVNLLGSDPERILSSASLSPGEARKVLLAIGIARVPHLIVMDEPTNHLDLPSIECLTDALAACECALLLVSHDERFLAALTTRRWEIAAGEVDARLREV